MARSNQSLLVHAPQESDRQGSFIEHWRDCPEDLRHSLVNDGFVSCGRGRVICHSCACRMFSVEEADPNMVGVFHSFFSPKCHYGIAVRGKPFIKAVSFVYLPLNCEDDENWTLYVFENIQISASFVLKCCCPGRADQNLPVFLHRNYSTQTVKMVREELLKAFDINSGLDDYELVKYSLDGSITVMHSEYFLARYCLKKTDILVIAPWGSTEDRPSWKTLGNKFRVTLK